MHRGWYQLAFERELNAGLTPFELDGRALVLVRDAERTRVFDGVCPHRGARLAGGTRVGETIVCPFHAYPIGLGTTEAASGLCVREYATRIVGGMLFVREPDGIDAGFEDALGALDAHHAIVPGFTRVTRARAELVVENAFDSAHFAPVHGVRNIPRFEVVDDPGGAFAVRGTLEVPVTPWQTGKPGAGGTIAVPFLARAFSPTLVLTELGGERPYAMLTATHDASPETAPAPASVVRLSLAFPTSHDRPSRDDVRYMLAAARSGLERDELIWQYLASTNGAGDFAADVPVAAFRRFCDGVRGGAQRAPT